MTELSDRMLGMRGRSRKYQLRPLVLLLVPVASILFQVYTPLFWGFFSFLELPLLVTVYFSLMRRDPAMGALIGCGIGLVQDAFSSNPLGVFGMVKTLVGFFAAHVSGLFDVENAVIRFGLGFFFFLFHQFSYWVLVRALLGQTPPFDFPQAMLFGLLNAAVAAPLFGLLDRL